MLVGYWHCCGVGGAVIKLPPGAGPVITNLWIQSHLWTAKGWYNVSDFLESRSKWNSIGRHTSELCIAKFKTELSCLDPDLDLDSKYCNVTCTSVQCTQLRLEPILITVLYSTTYMVPRTSIDYLGTITGFFIGRHPLKCWLFNEKSLFWPGNRTTVFVVLHPF